MISVKRNDTLVVEETGYGLGGLTELSGTFADRSVSANISLTSAPMSALPTNLCQRLLCVPISSHSFEY
jgi:hypothetical protein